MKKLLSLLVFLLALSPVGLGSVKEAPVPENTAPSVVQEVETSPDAEPPASETAAAVPQENIASASSASADADGAVTATEPSAEVPSVKSGNTATAQRPLPSPAPTGVTLPIPEPGSTTEPEPVPEPDPPQPVFTIIGNIYSCDEAAQAGHDHMTTYGWEYAADLSMAAGNCGYCPAVVLPAATLQNSGGQAALNQAVIDTVDDTYARLYARNGEDARWASVRCEVSYRESGDEYVINILYA